MSPDVHTTTCRKCQRQFIVHGRTLYYVCRNCENRPGGQS